MSDSYYAACRVDFPPEFGVNASTDTQRSINQKSKLSKQQTLSRVQSLVVNAAEYYRVFQ